MFLTALLNTALGAEAADVRQRLFRCVSIRENETARMPSPPCSMYRKKRPSWITGRTLTATRAAR
ncbi:putative host specificity protein J [Escherichia coli p0305293.5]|nr:putative host specificity protein J [Escherichia coli p0305293.5]